MHAMFWDPLFMLFLNTNAEKLPNGILLEICTRAMYGLKVVGITA